MKLKDTKGIKNLSIEGQSFTVDKDGTVDVPAELAEKLFDFGFQVHVEEDKKAVKKAVDK